MRVEFDAEALLEADAEFVKPKTSEITNTQGLDIRVEVFVRNGPNPKTKLFTVCLVNRKPASFSVNEFGLFQTRFRASLISNTASDWILPYPGLQREKLDDEEESLALLYRQTETFAIGHGCAADWKLAPNSVRAVEVTAECLPAFEAPSITPDIQREDGTLVEVAMAALAGLSPGDDGLASVGEVVERYRKWIAAQREEVRALDQRFQKAASRHLEECENCANRMQAGIEYLRSDQLAFRAFQLANHAILLQQLHSSREIRSRIYDDNQKRLFFSKQYQAPNPIANEMKRGKWRAFQIAFLLMAVRSTADPSDLDRSTVELIWFPTGGGKTEAYLALTAFSIFLRRLTNRDDVGVDVITRYTLRLLTAQQFQRASGLICAIEYLRRQFSAELGDGEFSIGIWLGGSSTPNSRSEAKSALRALRQGEKDAENPFVITKCPWCSASIGPLDLPGKIPSTIPRVEGYEIRGNTVAIICPDSTCDFSKGLPIYVIDEDIYEFRPTLVIGTVDKFAMLAWRPEARSLFGMSADGVRAVSPPNLIIQDELHLISGPLGSMVGLYEALIEELCTDRRGRIASPKIVSSTATIRRYSDQVKALYARDSVALFPPPGLGADDSFFARFARKQDGSLERGRLYVGIHAPGLGSLQTVQVRVFTSLLQAPISVSPEGRDPWWTLLAFFNSLRELGTTLSLFQSDIPDYFKVFRNRKGVAYDQLRRLRRVKELTGRLPSDEIPKSISELEATCGGDRPPIDVCLASNLIEVGVDIDRLSLLAVVGQPKTTSQYIQVTGRVGRLWKERPGLVVTIYGASKPRDRSHFEKFRTYHERLYAQVEPTSVTPFSRPALDRALHAVMVGYVRQFGDDDNGRSPYPFPAELLEQLRDIVLPRADIVDSNELASLERIFEMRAEEWRRWERTRYSGGVGDGELPLLRPAGGYASREHARISWSTPQSMRNVDAECQVEITTLYLNDGVDAND